MANTEAMKQSRRTYHEKLKRVGLVFREDKPEDIALFEKLRSQVSKDSELPALIKNLLTSL